MVLSMVAFILCVIAVYNGIKGILHSQDETIMVDGRVTEIQHNHLGYKAIVEYEYKGETRTTIVPAKANIFGGLKEGDVTSILLYENNGEQYQSPGDSYFSIVIGGGIAICIVVSLL